MSRKSVNSLFLALLLCASQVAVASGQSVPASERCHGERIDQIIFNPKPPPFLGAAKRWQAMARAVGLHHATTRASVLRTYLVVTEGDRCTEASRAESERILRALPFLADATVRATPDSSGGVRLEVATIDEIPVLVSGAIRHGSPAAVAVGNTNIGGAGLRGYVGVQRGFAYRNGARLRLTQYGTFGRQLTSDVDLARDLRGGHAEFGLAHPFLTDLQKGSFQATFRQANDYPRILRPFGDNAALSVERQRWSVGGVIRTRVGGLVALLGGAAIGNRITPAANGVVVTDSGLIENPDDVLRGRYSAYNATRLGGLLGVRRIQFTTVTGYDALFAPQDVATGLQIGTLIAPGMVRQGHGDVLVATSAYGGAFLGSSFLAAQVESEARQGFTDRRWDSMITSSRVAWYIKPSPRLLLTVGNEFSVGRRGRLPTQLSFADKRGGVRGYEASRLAGEERNVVRTELRWARPAWINHSDLGLSVFSDMGNLWAGGAPYGQTASARSVGFSILTAYPTQSKRLYRLDVAVPLQRGSDGGRGVVVRFSTGDPTAAFWTEPNDVVRSRLAPVPSSLFAWPTG